MIPSRKRKISSPEGGGLSTLLQRVFPEGVEPDRPQLLAVSGSGNAVAIFELFGCLLGGVSVLLGFLDYLLNTGSADVECFGRLWGSNSNSDELMGSASHGS